MHCLSMKRPAKIKLNMFLTLIFLSADQSSNENSNLKEEIKFLVNDKGQEKHVEKNFSFFEYVKFNDCEVNVFAHGVK